MKLFKNVIPLILTTSLTLGGCSYSFTGASIAPEVKTFSVDYFPNFTQLGPPLLSQLFTEKLKDLFLAQTSLKLVERNGDLRFEGKITNYRTAPVAIQANDQAAGNRLTITVLVKFTNTNDSKQNFETSFSRFADYESGESLASVEDELIEGINEQLAQDIFNKSVSNW